MLGRAQLTGRLTRLRAFALRRGKLRLRAFCASARQARPRAGQRRPLSRHSSAEPSDADDPISLGLARLFVTGRNQGGIMKTSRFVALALAASILTATFPA